MSDMGMFQREFIRRKNWTLRFPVLQSSLYHIPENNRCQSNQRRKPRLVPLRDLGVRQQEPRKHHRRE